MFETFAHTADLGLRVRAATLDVLFSEAGQGLGSIIAAPEAVEPRESIEISLEADDLEYLLFDWLSELLYASESRQWLISRCEAHVSELALKARVWGEPVDRQRHRLEHEVKAITYHGLKVERQEEGWLAEVILDI